MTATKEPAPLVESINGWKFQYKVTRARTRFPDILGLYVDSWSPGDGKTRYRFFLTPTDYFAGSGIYTALGSKEATTFALGFKAGQIAEWRSLC